MRGAINVALALLLSRRARDIVRIHYGPLPIWVLAILFVGPIMFLMLRIATMPPPPKGHGLAIEGNVAATGPDSINFSWPPDGQGSFTVTINGVPQPVSHGDCVYLGSGGVWKAGACTGDR